MKFTVTKARLRRGISPGIPRENCRGISRAVAILLVLVAVMLVVVSIPTYRYFWGRSQELGCGAALRSARGQVITAYLMAGAQISAKEVKEVATFAMNGWEDLCPAGGNVYVVETGGGEGEMPYDLVCGIHGEARQRCRLNAGFVLDTVREQVILALAKGEQPPESVALTLNGEPFTVLLTETPTGLKRGTSSTTGVEGTLAFYGLAGRGEVGANTDLPEGYVCYFSFADENYCANWSDSTGWVASAYEG